MINSPYIVWQRDKWRIVAVEDDDRWDALSVDDVDDDLDATPRLVLEERCQDALGADCWVTVAPVGDDAWDEPFYRMVLEVASRCDVAPRWVKDLVRRQIEQLDDDAASSAGGPAA